MFAAGIRAVRGFDDRFHLIGVEHRKHDLPASFADFFGRCTCRAAESREVIAALGGDVESGDRKTGLQQPLRE